MKDGWVVPGNNADRSQLHSLLLLYCHTSVKDDIYVRPLTSERTNAACGRSWLGLSARRSCRRSRCHGYDAKLVMSLRASAQFAAPLLYGCQCSGQ